VVGFGEIGMGTFRAIRPWPQWIAGWGYDINGPDPDLRPEAVLAWVTRYSKGRVY
jgi:2,4-dichlorophenol 6-monooxygenase